MDTGGRSERSGYYLLILYVTKANGIILVPVPASLPGIASATVCLKVLNKGRRATKYMTTHQT